MSIEALKPFYNSRKWRNTSLAYRQKRALIDGGLCEMCKSHAGTEVHHKIGLNEQNYKNPEISFNEENFQLLCKECHFRTRDDNFGKIQQQKVAEGGTFFEFEQDNKPATTQVTETKAEAMPKLKPQKVYLVYGPPFAGKKKYVKKHMQNGDLIVDFNDIFSAVSASEYDYPQSLFGLACDVRDFIYDKIKRREVNAKAVWVIETLPDKTRRENRAKQLGAELIYISATYEDCIAAVHRNKKIKDKNLYFRIISKYFQDFIK